MEDGGEPIHGWDRDLPGPVVSSQTDSSDQFPWGLVTRDFIENTNEAINNSFDGLHRPNQLRADSDSDTLTFSISSESSASYDETYVDDWDAVDIPEPARNANSVRNHRSPLCQYLPTSSGPRVTNLRTQAHVPIRADMCERLDRWCTFGMDARFSDSRSVPTSCTRIHYGNRSFEPKAKFNDDFKAYPAKSGVPSFSHCHEKALASCSVYQSIQNDNSDEEDLTANADVFGHFWLETNTVGGDNYGFHRIMPSPSENVLAPTVPAIMPDHQENYIFAVDTPEYQQWDAQTSIVNNPLNYDLWNEISADPELSQLFQSGMNMGSQSGGVSDSSTGATYGGHTDTEVEDALLDEDEDSSRSWPVITERIGPSPGVSDSRCLSPQTRDFYRTIGLIDEGGDDNRQSRSSFTLDRPLMPDSIASQISQDQIPRSFLQKAHNGGDMYLNEFISEINLNGESREDHDYNSESSDDEQDSVFLRVPEVDTTSSSLWNKFCTADERKPDEDIKKMVDAYFLSFSNDPVDPDIPPAIDDVAFDDIPDFASEIKGEHEKHT